MEYTEIPGNTLYTCWMYKEGVCLFFKNKADTDWVSIFEYPALEIKLDNRHYYYAAAIVVSYFPATWRAGKLRQMFHEQNR
jgi:hypothetical protein